MNVTLHSDHTGKLFPNSSYLPLLKALDFALLELHS